MKQQYTGRTAKHQQNKRTFRDTTNTNQQQIEQIT